ncbi:ParB/RepB/Spo0J family partition protein [Streptomyces sp. NPDC006283]|uniref:ParB/RepB/Spo0J family partition protein n=1 Tax=Streptomyces sp. NPDC006283 TaxID=3156741 RepID=UPI0033BE5B59
MPRGKQAGASANAPKDEPIKEQPLVISGGGKEVPVSKVEPNPRNLRGEDLWDSPEEKAEMVASLKEVGLIQAVVVARREAFLSRYPEDEAGLGDARYVVMAGHRRFDAVLAAGQNTVRIDVQDDMVAHLNLVMLEENLKRRGLDVFQEGEGYRRTNIEDQLSYQAIATATGRSKSHITKRVKLLELPEDGRLLVKQRRISIDSAYNLLTALGQGNEHRFVEGHEVMAERGLTAKEAANVVLSPSLSVSDRNQAAAPGLEPDWAEPSSGREASAAVGVLTQTERDSSPNSADVSAPIPHARSIESTASAASKTKPPITAEDDADRSAANSGRNQACQQLVRHYEPETVDQETARIAASCVASAAASTLARAHSWLQEAEAANATAMTPSSYRDSVLLASDGPTMVRLAYAISLAEHELRASDRRRRWDHRDVAHVQHLQDSAAYKPTAWEQRHLD